MTWQERCEEGRRLAPDADDPATHARLLELLLDDEDTGVTYETALALLRRHDAVGVDLVVAADVAADGNTSAWIFGALLNFRAESLGADDEFLQAALGELARTGTPAQRESARQMLDELGLGQA